MCACWHTDLSEVGSEVRQQLLQDGSIEVVPHEVTLDYSYWSTDHILKVRACPRILLHCAHAFRKHVCHGVSIACFPLLQ